MWIWCAISIANVIAFLLNYFTLIIFAAIINISGHFKLVKGNYRDDGYYRVNYDPESWKAITDQLMINHEVNSFDKFRLQMLKTCNYHNLNSNTYSFQHKSNKPQEQGYQHLLCEQINTQFHCCHHTAIKITTNIQQTIFKP